MSFNLHFLCIYNVFCTPPLCGAPHAHPTTSDCMLSGQSVSKSSVITPRRTPTSHLHYTLNNEPIPVIIHRLPTKYFAHCPSHPNPLVQQIGNYTLTDLTNKYRKYRLYQEECARFRESVPYVKLYRYNPKHLYPKLNGYGDNGQRSVKF